jgi:hypothetical protein
MNSRRRRLICSSLWEGRIARPEPVVRTFPEPVVRTFKEQRAGPARPLTSHRVRHGRAQVGRMGSAFAADNGHWADRPVWPR